MELQRGMRVTILGASGSGKSTLARALFLRYLFNNARDRYYVLDIYPTHYIGNDHLSGLSRHGFARINITPDILDRLGEGDYEFKIDAYNWDELVGKIGKAVFVIELPPELRTQAANNIARAIRRRGNAVVLIDEVGAFLSNVERKIGDLAMLLTSGRPNGVDTIVVSQHANFTHPLLRAAVTHVVTFRCTAENELNMLEQTFPGKRGDIPSLDYTKREFLMADVTRGIFRRDSLQDILPRAAASPAQT
ncbi:MAG: hypothetical protein QXX19_07220 [Candidatus Caldarchaeum sp.]